MKVIQKKVLNRYNKTHIKTKEALVELCSYFNFKWYVCLTGNSYMKKLPVIIWKNKSEQNVEIWLTEHLMRAIIKKAIMSSEN